MALCVVDLVDCRRMWKEDEPGAMCPHDEVLFSWVLENVRCVKPFAVRGALKLFEVEISESELEGMTGMKTKKKKAKAKVSKKKTDKQNLDNEEKGGIRIVTKAKLSMVVIKPHGVVIGFKGMDLRADHVRRMSIWTKESEPLFVTVDGDISTRAKLGKCVTTEKGDAPVFTDMVFSAGQCEKLCCVVKSECEVEIKIEIDTQGLFPDEGQDKT